MVRAWYPEFRVMLGVGREEMLDLSIPEMVDLIDYYREVQRG